MRLLTLGVWGFLSVMLLHVIPAFGSYLSVAPVTYGGGYSFGGGGFSGGGGFGGLFSMIIFLFVFMLIIGLLFGNSGTGGLGGIGSGTGNIDHTGHGSHW